jgi:hypothetical protein
LFLLLGESGLAEKEHGLILRTEQSEQKGDEPMQVRVPTQVLEIAEERVSVKEFEGLLFEAVREFVNAAWQSFVWAVEVWAAGQHPAGDLRAKGRERRGLLTTSGPVTFTRGRFTSPSEEHSFMLFDKRVGLRNNQRSTAAADLMMAEAAAESPYAPAARSLERCWGQRVGAMRLWSAVQRVGRELKVERKELRDSVFRDGELPGWEQPAPDYVGLEADSIMLAAWRGGGKRHEVYVGISYTGKAEHRGRYRLLDKGICYGLEGSARFGQDFFAMAQKRHNIVDANYGTFLSDGAEALRNIQREHFPRHVRGMDWRHIRAKLEETYRPIPGELHKERLKDLYAERREAACQQIRRDRQRFPQRAERLGDLCTYIENAGDDLYAIRRLRRAGWNLPPRLQGSGGIERNEDILVGQRMKRSGMSWTHSGADHLLAVRINLPVTLKRIPPRRS